MCNATYDLGSNELVKCKLTEKHVTTLRGEVIHIGDYLSFETSWRDGEPHSTSDPEVASRYAQRN